MCGDVMIKPWQVIVFGPVFSFVGLLVALVVAPFVTVHITHILALALVGLVVGLLLPFITSHVSIDDYTWPGETK